MATSPSSTELRVRFTHPHGPDHKNAVFPATTTGREALAGFIEAGFIPAPPSDSVYGLAVDRPGKAQGLNLDKPLAAQGVATGDTVKILDVNAGASSCRA
jgi:hypothetical protein